MIRGLGKIAAALAGLPLLAGAAGAPEVYLALDASGQGHYKVDGRFWTPGDPPIAWEVLADYEHLPLFITSLKTSRVLERSAHSLVLRQEAVGQAFVVLHRRLRVLLKVSEVPDRRIVFEDTSHEDFLSYSGSWEIEEAAGGGSWVGYHLAATPDFFAPAYIARKAFKKNARDLLLSVQSEMLRRGHLKDTLLCCSNQ